MSLLFGLIFLFAGSPAWAAPEFLDWSSRQAPPELHPERAAGYGFAADLYGRIASLVRDSPGLIQPERIGRSVEGRPLWAFHVRDPGHEVRARVLVFAQLHALEWIGGEVATALLEELVEAPPPHVLVTVVPLMNPDGRERAEQDLLAGDTRAYRRANANGTDLNRDFAVHRDNDNVWSTAPFTRRYYGVSEGPLSQPESQALDALAARGDYDVSVDLHAFGGFIEIPWAGRWAHTPDHDRMMELGSVMSAGQLQPYRVIQLSRYAFFFRALGTAVDHMYATYGCDSYLIELTHSGMRLKQPSTLREPFRWYNPVDPAPHVANGVGALWALVQHLSFEARAAEG